MGKRNKKRFCGQQMLVQLQVLAHNVLIWGKEWLLPAVPRLAKYGVQRLVRDVWGILGRVEWTAERPVAGIRLTEANPLAAQLLPGLQRLVAASGVVVGLGPP